MINDFQAQIPKKVLYVVLHDYIIFNLRADLLLTHILVFGLLDMIVFEFFTTQFTNKRRGQITPSTNFQIMCHLKLF